MAANNLPIFPLTPKVGLKTLVTADTSTTAPTTQGQILLTAGTDGMRVDAIIAKPQGTNTASVLRVFVNDGLGTAASNFALVAEVTLAATTASSTAQLATYILKPLDQYAPQDNEYGTFPSALPTVLNVLPSYLPSGYKIYVAIGTTVATGWAITGLGGDY